MTTNLAPVLRWKANFSRHSYLAGYIKVTLSQVWVFTVNFSCQEEKPLNTLPGYALDSNVHPLTSSIP
jgi:hypothetical protein